MSETQEEGQELREEQAKKEQEEQVKFADKGKDRICVNCIHYPEEPNVRSPKCANTKDLVSGAIGSVSCYDERYKMGIGGNCGLTGKFYQVRPNV